MADTATKPRLKTRYQDEIKPALREQFDYSNVMQIPGVVKVVVNMGVGDAARDSKLIEGASRPHGHHRPEAGRDQGSQVHRAVQAA
jgi:large subunit ribosomal protein L5